MYVPKVLTIAGSDSGGGAGIQADLKTFTSMKVYGASIITTLTAQNTLGVDKVFPVTESFVRKQFEAVLSDIPMDAAKTGMLNSAEIIIAVSEMIKKYNITNLVVDPVMVSTSGSTLLPNDSIKALIDNLIPLSLILTPNLDEAKVLTGLNINSIHDMELACKKLHQLGSKFVLLKGGHLPLNQELESCVSIDAFWVIDMLFDGQEFYRIRQPYIQTTNTHGSGCTLSSAIAARLAKGDSVREAVEKGIEYTQHAIKEAFPVGSGNGPLNHFHSKV